jgi:hypothetical protein
MREAGVITLMFVRALLEHVSFLSLVALRDTSGRLGVAEAGTALAACPTNSTGALYFVFVASCCIFHV